MRMRFFVSTLLLIGMALATTTGCGESDPEPTEANDVLNVLANISDAGSNPEKLKEIFAESAIPDKAWLQEASQYTIRAIDAEITGDTATATVDLEVNATGEVASEQTWNCERSGETWKITSAPLK